MKFTNYSDGRGARLKSNSITCRHAILIALVGFSVSLNWQLTTRASDEAVRENTVSFRNDVLPVLAKFGCNTGACHGALAGKGGFKLSLRGYNPLADYEAIAVEARGRRIELSDPGRSLLLAKPSGAIPHKGGLRFGIDSEEYETLAKWIAQGAPPPAEDDAMVIRVEVQPDRSTLKLDEELPLVVKAHYSDGTIRDVTRWAKYESTDVAVATVDDTGNVSVMGPGKGAISVWYASKIAIARATVPFANTLNAKSLEFEDAANFIDELVVDELKNLNLPASPAANDSEWLRRVYLDTIGCLPTAEEVRSFLRDDREDKRSEVVEALLQRTEYIDYWTYKWSDLLLVSGRKLRPESLKTYYFWIRKQVEENTPWDQFAHEIVTAKGNSTEQGATNFFGIHQDPESMTENVCQAFLGLSIGCAKCHDHPLEKWTNDQYYAMASMFARVRGKGWGGDPRSGEGSRTTYVADSGELLQPSTGKPQPPAPLDGEPLPEDYQGDRREVLAEWLTSPHNPYFARAIVNRVWANFFNVGLVEQVDDLRVSNPASNERLLDALADYLIENDFSIQQLIRLILESNTYARSSLTLPGNADDSRFYSRYYPKRLMAEVLHDAIVQVTGVPSKFDKISLQGTATVGTKFYPEGTRALELYDSAVRSQFLKSFGRTPRTITCECERSSEPSIVQVLHLANGDTINQKLSTKDNRVAALLKDNLPDYRLIEEIYLRTLSRYSTDEEMQSLLPLLAASTEEAKRLAVEDLLWSVLSSREFLFNH